MIDYDPRRWDRELLVFRGSIRVQALPRILLCVLWAAGVVGFHRWIHPVDLSDKMHMLIGLALGLLLVFRTNCSYDRFWEGRKLWAGLTATCRNLGRAASVHLAGSPALLRRLLTWLAAYPHAALHLLRDRKGL